MFARPAGGAGALWAPAAPVVKRTAQASANTLLFITASAASVDSGTQSVKT
jgi:hypothetical protein